MKHETEVQGKVPYTAPALTVYGDARTVTQSLTTGVVLDVPSITSIFHHSV